MQATTFWEEVIMLASAATVKTEQGSKDCGPCCQKKVSRFSVAEVQRLR